MIVIPLFDKRLSCFWSGSYRQADLPHDVSGGTSERWRGQVEEAYIKGCMTGELKPKPDVDGVDAVTAVPVTAPPAAPSASASPAP